MTTLLSRAALACLALAHSPFTLPGQQDEVRPEPVKTSITVTEKIAAEAPASITVLDAATVQRTPGYNLDDRLRQVPGFSLFRRTSSVVAHPTTQGISLRGIGSSGASRSLVLWDGLPVNDPFGGWVYWTRLNPDEMERVEVSRGASTALFGDRAMTGALGLFSRPPQHRHLFAKYSGGNLNTHDASLGMAGAWPRFAVSGWGRALTTGGYFIVPEANRGPVDQRAGVRFVTGDLRLDSYNPWGNLFFRIDMLAEQRKNGTLLTRNSTGLGSVSLRYARDTAGDSLSVFGLHFRESFRGTFTSVPPGRRVENLSFTQTVPAEAVTTAVLWQRRSTRLNLVSGFDLNRAEGISTDSLASGGTRVGGGAQLQQGLFAQADVTLGALRLFGGLRHTFIFQSSYFATPGGGGEDSGFWSPSGGVVVGRGGFRWRASAYRSFRNPTLNELFREFRVGNTITQANAGLTPESLWGIETGVDWAGERSRFRLTAYRNSLDRLITNVTVSSSGGAIVRQRRNAAEAVSRGFEAGYDRRWGNLSGEVAYLFVDSRYLTGLRVAQVPRHQGSAHLGYRRGGTLASTGVRASSYQFDDDLNTRNFRLAGYPTVMLMLRQRLRASLSAEASLENLLGRRFYTAFTPTPNIGMTRQWRVGLRWDGGL